MDSVNSSASCHGHTVNTEVYIARYTEYYTQTAYPLVVFFSIMMVTGIIGNSIVTLVYIFKKNKSIANYFMLSLSTVDLASCCILHPYLIYKHLHFLSANTIVCKTFEFLIHCMLAVQIGILLAIAVDRFYAICRPLRFIYAYNRLVIMSIMSVANGIVMSLPLLVFYGQKSVVLTVDNNQVICGHICHYSDLYDGSVPASIFGGFMAIIMLTIVAIMTVLYTLVTIETCKKSRRIHPAKLSIIKNEFIESKHSGNMGTDCHMISDDSGEVFKGDDRNKGNVFSSSLIHNFYVTGIPERPGIHTQKSGISIISNEELDKVTPTEVKASGVCEQWVGQLEPQLDSNGINDCDIKSNNLSDDVLIQSETDHSEQLDKIDTTDKNNKRNNSPDEQTPNICVDLTEHMKSTGIKACNNKHSESQCTQDIAEGNLVIKANYVVPIVDNSGSAFEHAITDDVSNLHMQCCLSQDNDEISRTCSIESRDKTDQYADPTQQTLVVNGNNIKETAAENFKIDLYSKVDGANFPHKPASPRKTVTFEEEEVLCQTDDTVVVEEVNNPNQSELTIRDNEKDKRKSKLLTGMKVVKMLFIVTVVFFLSWLPFWVLRIMEIGSGHTSLSFDAPMFNDIVSILLTHMFYLNNSINPLLYCVVNRHFRSDLMAFLKHKKKQKVSRRKRRRSLES